MRSGILVGLHGRLPHLHQVLVNDVAGLDADHAWHGRCEPKAAVDEVEVWVELLCCGPSRTQYTQRERL